jgi:hypothetical protein
MRCTAIATLIVAAIASGCGDEPASAERVTGEFFAALQDGDGSAACAALSGAVRETLERDERAPCPEAVVSLGLESGDVTQAQVYVTQAQVALSNGQFAFLGRTPEGWKLDAAGCAPSEKDEPFDCELES